MALDSAFYPSGGGAFKAAAEPRVLREEFERGERLVVLAGASAAGASVGFAVALGMGRSEFWLALAALGPLFAIAVHLTLRTLIEARARDARGCAAAAAMHLGLLALWPIASLATPMGQIHVLYAPLLGLAALAMFASCWSGPPRAVYRMMAQGALVAAAAANQGVMWLLA